MRVVVKRASAPTDSEYGAGYPRLFYRRTFFRLYTRGSAVLVWWCRVLFISLARAYSLEKRAPTLSEYTATNAEQRTWTIAPSVGRFVLLSSLLVCCMDTQMHACALCVRNDRLARSRTTIPGTYDVLKDPQPTEINKFLREMMRLSFSSGFKYEGFVRIRKKIRRERFEYGENWYWDYTKVKNKEWMRTERRGAAVCGGAATNAIHTTNSWSHYETWKVFMLRNVARICIWKREALGENSGRFESFVSFLFPFTKFTVKFFSYYSNHNYSI